MDRFFWEARQTTRPGHNVRATARLAKYAQQNKKSATSGLSGLRLWVGVQPLGCNKQAEAWTPTLESKIDKALVVQRSLLPQPESFNPEATASGGRGRIPQNTGAFRLGVKRQIAHSDNARKKTRNRQLVVRRCLRPQPNFERYLVDSKSPSLPSRREEHWYHPACGQGGKL